MRTKVRDNVKVDENGRLFVGSFMDWASSVIAEGRAVLKERTHPGASAAAAAPPAQDIALPA